MKKIVLTGGPCSGKTATIEELSKRGFPVLEETAKKIIAMRRNIPLTKEESLIRQDLIFKEQFKKEKIAENDSHKILFLDRGLIDGLAYSIIYSGRTSIKKYLPLVKKENYHLVFLLELLPFNSEGFRAEDNEEEAKKIHKSLLNLYKKLEYEPIFVPKMAIDERTDFILGYLC